VFLRNLEQGFVKGFVKAQNWLVDQVGIGNLIALTGSIRNKPVSYF
jgi:hypothetical protein